MGSLRAGMFTQRNTPEFAYCSHLTKFLVCSTNLWLPSWLSPSLTSFSCLFPVMFFEVPLYFSWRILFGSQWHWSLHLWSSIVWTALHSVWCPEIHTTPVSCKNILNFAFWFKILYKCVIEERTVQSYKTAVFLRIQKWPVGTLHTPHFCIVFCDTAGLLYFLCGFILVLTNFVSWTVLDMHSTCMSVQVWTNLSLFRGKGIFM